MALDPRVTFLVGDNGSGKSTLIEAFAVASGLNAEGGSRNFSYSTRDSHSGLSRALRLIRGERRPRTDYFLRAASFFTAATSLEVMRKEAAEAGVGGDPLASYGGRSLHEQSHGESFLALLLNRFGGEGSQFIVATHTPILLTRGFLAAPERFLSLLMD